jgi:hypothetical protein
MLEGCARGEDLRGLTASHFYGSTNQLLFAVISSMRELGADPTDERVLATVERVGYRAPLLAEELDTIRWLTPTCFHVRPHVVRIIDAHRRRTALDYAERACAALRVGLDPNEYLAHAIATLAQDGPWE